MAGCKGTLPGIGALVVAAGLPFLQQQEQAALGSGSNMATGMDLPQGVPSTHIDVDLREIYFLVMHFLADGPCTRAFGQLWNELLQHKLLPRRYHARYSRNGQPSEDENDDGFSFPLSYGDVASRHPSISNNHLVDLLQQLLMNNRRSVNPLDSQSKIVTAADTPTLLGTGAFSLLDLERSKQKGAVSRWTQIMRWPHWHADQVHAMILRELGGGFGRHHRSPSVRTASYVIAKPSVFLNRIQVIKKLRGHRNAVYCAIFDRNGQHVITGSDDRLVKIWSMETGLCLRSCRGHEGDITDLAVNSDNYLVASASNDFSIRVWNLQNGFPVSVLRGHGGAVTAITFSPRQGCEHHLLSSSDDGTCRIWDARDSFVNSRVYMPDPKEAQTAARGIIPQATPVPPAGNQILCCSFNADGSIFVTGSSDKIARVWNPCKWNDEMTGRPNHEMDMLQGHENDVNYVQFSGCAALTRSSLVDNAKGDNQPRFKNTWSSHDSIVTCSRDGTAIIWTPRPRRHHAKAGRWVKAYHLRVPPPPMPPQPPRPGGPRQRLLPTPRGVNMIVWSLDNRFVLAAIMDCRICVWNAVDGSLVHSLTGHDKQTYVLDVHPFNPRIAMSAGYDGRVIIWDIWDGHPIRIYDTGDYNLVDGNFSPDGSSLVVSDEVGQIYLFATGEGNSQKDAKYDQFFLGDFRPLVRDTHGNVLDQETQLPPHQRNIQDLLCDANMIPYAEPYQTIYQQRRLGALGIDWQPPAVSLQIGTLDDLNFAGPPEPPIPLQAAVRPSPDPQERRAAASESGTRWVEQPNEVDETMDWEQEIVELTEDSGSDYSASEESEDVEKADTLDEVGTEEDQGEEDDDYDELSRDIPCSLRRSSRNKRRAEMVTYSLSGRGLKRKKYDGGGDTRGGGRWTLRKRKLKPSWHSPARPPGESSSRQVGMYQPEPAIRPKRQAARNALHLFSSLNDDAEEEEAATLEEKTMSDQMPRVSAFGVHQRVLRSRNREEADQPSTVLQTQRHKMESADRGEMSRRPRSGRKLVVKLRSLPHKVDCEDSRPDLLEEPPQRISATDGPVTPSVSNFGSNAGASENTPIQDRPLWKLIVKHPRLGGVKRHAALLESSKGNHDNGNADEPDTCLRILGSSHLSNEDQLESDQNALDEERRDWQRRTGKGVKRTRGEVYVGNHGYTSPSFGSDSLKEVQDDWRDGVDGCVIISPAYVSVDVKDSGRELWDVNELKSSVDARIDKANQSYMVEVNKMTNNRKSTMHIIGEGGNRSGVHDLPPKAEGGDRVVQSVQQTDRADRGSDHLSSSRTRIRHLNTVLSEGGFESRPRTGKATSIIVEPTEALVRTERRNPVQRICENGATDRCLRVRHGRHVHRLDKSADNVLSLRGSLVGIAAEQEGEAGGVKSDRQGSASLEILEGEDSTEVTTREKRTPCSSLQEEGRREQWLDKDGENISKDSVPSNANGKSIGGQLGVEKQKSLSWLLLTEVEAGTRYIPQYGDHVVYLRQGHQEFLDEIKSEEKGPWRTAKFPIRAVEFCCITALQYSILQETGQTCCKLTMTFTDKESKGYGKSFKLTLPELTNFPDFIVERSRYDGSISKGWRVRDKCQVWWRSEDEVGGGQWWDGRVQRVKAKSLEFPDSPWDRLHVLYRLDSNKPTSHSPWELFEPGNHWHDPPRIDQESKLQLVNVIEELEKASYMSSEDEYGLRRLSEDVEDRGYLNRTPLPLDLETVKKRLEKDYYHSLEAFCHDIKLLVLNAESYYGIGTETRRTQRLVQVLLDVLSNKDEPALTGGDDGNEFRSFPT